MNKTIHINEKYRLFCLIFHSQFLDVVLSSPVLELFTVITSPNSLSMKILVYLSI